MNSERREGWAPYTPTFTGIDAKIAPIFSLPGAKVERLDVGKPYYWSKLHVVKHDFRYKLAGKTVHLSAGYERLGFFEGLKYVLKYEFNKLSKRGDK